MATVKKIPFGLPSEARFYDIQSHPKGLGYLAIEFDDKARTKRSGWKSHHTTQELCETAIRMRKTHLDGKNYLGLFKAKIHTNQLD